ncbi:tetratricopeptide repeat protein 33 isoform X2 [Ambystoma mexicanum]|uniref:tetratricopeptide repeat protein 33 isoform X2 n=1 Tax=Ambystoma mexicanum TaxID=8296 RepID=UPI0037E7D2AE
MASFGWKRKVGEKVSKTTSKQFEAEAADEGLLVDSENVDWVSAIKRKKEVLQEDNTVKSKRLKDEGILMAENERYREAVQKWDEALHLTPEDAALYEMKSQAVRSFQVALHIFPSNRELWEEDLSWARQLLEKKMAAEKAELPGGESKGAALEVIPDYDFESDEIVEVCAAIAQKHKSAQADDKTVVIMSASGTVETRTEKEENASTPDKNIFIKAK